MKIQLNSINFYDDISPQEEIIDSMDNSTKLILIGKSGIHIKKKNRGKFTSYCGGEVTDACILKGKNSSNPAIRKRATFADNARKWKHLLGGILMPGIDQDISLLFVDVPDPTPYQKKLEQNNLFIKDEIVLPTIQTKQSIDALDPDEDLGGGEFVNDVSTAPSDTKPITTLFSIKRIDFNTAQMSDNLRNLLQPYIGIQSNGWGHFDCSDFVRHVYKNLTGNSRSIYKQVDPINKADLKPGDLVFLKGTNSNISPNLVSHVAIVTNTDRIGEGIIQIAQGSPNKTTGLREWNLNDKYFDTHWVGGGRLKTPSAKLGMKFQNGGYFIGNLPEFIKPIKKPFQLPYIVDQLDYVPSLTSEILLQKVSQEILPDWFTTPYNPPKKLEKKLEQKLKINYSTTPGYRQFKQYWDEYVKIDPDAKRFEKVLTNIAKHESNFNFSILNTAGAPAYGCFQFWLDGNINNITRFSGLSIDEFTRNPQAQIAAAVKMARSIENQFNSEDLRIASARGYNMNLLIRGAWLGGVGGVRKVLRGLGNPNDGKWYANGKGRSVKDAMNEQI